MLSDTLKSLFAVVENYPDLKANQNVLSLQEELTATENKIAFARQFYNDSVLTYNNAIQMFPTQHHRRHVQLHRARVLRRAGGRDGGPQGRPAVTARRGQRAAEVAKHVRADPSQPAGFVAAHGRRRRAHLHGFSAT